MKRFMKYFWLWLIPITLYIMEIVIVCVFGTSLTNNIMAWLVVIYLTILLGIDKTLQVCRSEEGLEKAKAELDKTLEEIINCWNTDNTQNNELNEEDTQQKDETQKED